LIKQPEKHLVTVIGAGPAGMYASRELALAGETVVLLNRDIKPGGLAEYGIYYDKHKMKEGLRRQFRAILDIPNIHYFGNVSIGHETGFTLDELRAQGVQAILVAVGAQGTKWLGLPGEELKRVYHAKDLVYHYNDLPPYSYEQFPIGRRVALIGVGNVMLDIAHWLVRELKVDEIVAVARRGPAEVKFTKKEMEYIARNLDVPALDTELQRVAPVMAAVGQDVQAARDYILAALPKALEPVSNTCFRFDFLASPTRILGDEKGEVCGLEVEDTTLVASNGDTKARGLGTRRILNVDTVVFCIGDRVDEKFGLPVKWNEFVKNPHPAFAVEGVSYEAYDPYTDQPIKDVFVAGWSREASSGLVGVAKKDGENGARAITMYLQTVPTRDNGMECLHALSHKIRQVFPCAVTKEDICRLQELERQEAERRGVEFFKFKSNEEMLAALQSDCPFEGLKPVKAEPASSRS
jgi:ferredoxin--NADP+ reductase